jgi:hypothetical protein
LRKKKSPKFKDVFVIQLSITTTNTRGNQLTKRQVYFGSVLDDSVYESSPQAYGGRSWWKYIVEPSAYFMLGR